MTSIPRLLISVGMVLAVLLPAQAQAGDWELLGERSVNFGTDHDTIRVTAAEGSFSKIKLRVLRRGIELVDLKVFYRNGRVQDVSVRSFIAAGGETRIIDLVGTERFIKKVEFVYRSRGRGRGRAVVRLFGKEETPGPADVPKVSGSWERLGTRTVKFATDRDVIPVTATEGTFDKIKLKVLSSGIEMLDLKVHFANGGTQDVSIKRFIEAGGETRVIDLTGSDRVIRNVEMVYRSRGPRTGRAIVELWGRH